MLSVVSVGDGVVELSWGWLPTFVVMNGPMLRAVEEKMLREFAGRPIDLMAMHRRVVELIVDAHPGITGLSAYLLAMEQVGLKDEKTEG